MKLKRRLPRHPQWGHADFFDIRRKRQILHLAEAKTSDVVYDMGCGDASFLILAVEEFGIREAVGFENMPQRIALARRKIAARGLEDRITIQNDMYEAELTKADVIFDMLPEGENDYEELYLRKVRKGTRLVKHDLPLIGINPDSVELPFYRMTFPLRKAKTRNQWASKVLGTKNATVEELWHELYYYGYEKIYNKWDVQRIKRILYNRIK